MEMLSFGQPLGAIMQVAYLVEDIDQALAHWTKVLGVGPFFLFEHFAFHDAMYRGVPTEVDMTIGLSFSGSVNVALLVQNNGAPSIYRESVLARGYGFHHWAISTRTYDADVRRYEGMGAPVVFSGVAGVGARAAYLDTAATLGAITELIEINPRVEGFFGALRRAAWGWDGVDPVRRFDGQG
ncbi:MAG: VOC family protein [Hyphomonadaceae bacterium]|nr:VOC family protein [Hyphomonadaceae bacterium]